MKRYVKRWKSFIGWDDEVKWEFIPYIDRRAVVVTANGKVKPSRRCKVCHYPYVCSTAEDTSRFCSLTCEKDILSTTYVKTLPRKRGYR